MKIGMVSHYYESVNYGGNLQSYALCRVLEQQGVEAEQICLRDRNQRLPWERRLLGMPLGRLLGKGWNRVNRTLRKWITRLVLGDLGGMRRSAFAFFQTHRIPHSPCVYNGQTIPETCGQYDAFITGSDQVWNLEWYHPAYYLTFAGEKPKFSYAASMGRRNLSQRERQWIRRQLEDFAGISVREARMADLLTEAVGRRVEWVLDPTLLLDAPQWNQVCAPAMVEGKYLFCCFLGSARGARRLAKAFARDRGLKIVTIPHLEGLFTAADVCFGDIRLTAPSPEEFLSLIRHAECVFTDSFHATALSVVYQREYFVFPRGKGMDERIYSLTALLGSESRFCHRASRRRCTYVLGCDRLDYAAALPRLEEKRAQSMAYLERCLTTAKKWKQKHEA